MTNIQETATNEEVVNEEVIETVETNEEVVEQLTPDELQAKIAEYEAQLKESEESRKQLDATLEKLNLTTTLANEGLNEFQGLFELETTEQKVAFLKEVKNKILVSNSYQPTETTKQDEYSTAIQNNDVKSALGFKFSKLFSK